LHLPPNIPAKDFWSIVVYDNQTRSMLQTDQRLPAVGSQKGAVANPDTSVDVYFGPTAPAGHEANWVQTIPGKGWNVLLRLYGPLQPWYEKTWRPGEIELVKSDSLPPPAVAKTAVTLYEIRRLASRCPSRESLLLVQFFNCT